MNMQRPPRTVRNAVTTLYFAAALAVISAAVIVIAQTAGGGLAQHLHQIYPQRDTDQIGMAESSILTYLFTLAVAGTVLFLWMARASQRGKRWVRGVGAAVIVLGSLMAAYNFSQPHPLVMTLAGVLPCLGGLTAVALLWNRKSSSYFKNHHAATSA
ncbi:hypothetical protein [Amycolatopsis taiwanensis]|uniref:Uncharacterized protein n=1 Tax=Amycolatopsis taiwanensis TaxID=342230 RepID=A0A9W6VFJ5_9PSEU|nr:hypothetical protein [Amycolatopsis taiwanensis]GLY64566.1 hypothetical protein Atai01_11850 [Amycolatopsis taiwanensis]